MPNIQECPNLLTCAAAINLADYPTNKEIFDILRNSRRFLAFNVLGFGVDKRPEAMEKSLEKCQGCGWGEIIKDLVQKLQAETESKIA